MLVISIAEERRRGLTCYQYPSSQRSHRAWSSSDVSGSHRINVAERPFSPLVQFLNRMKTTEPRLLPAWIPHFMKRTHTVPILIPMYMSDAAYMAKQKKKKQQ